MWTKRVLVAGLLAATAGAVTANADTLNISGIAGVWQNPVGGSSLTGVGSSILTWGGGVDFSPSAYQFAAGDNILAVAPDTPLLLGTFTHVNNPIPIPNLTGVDLSLVFTTNGQPTAVGAIIPFSHNETQNTITGCCDDTVTITTPVLNLAIKVGSDQYYFNLLGFSKDDGLTFASVFTSPEGGTNSARLYGRITATPVPEPVPLVLVGTGLAMIAFSVSRRRRTASAGRLRHRKGLTQTAGRVV